MKGKAILRLTKLLRPPSDWKHVIERVDVDILAGFGSIYAFEFAEDVWYEVSLLLGIA